MRNNQPRAISTSSRKKTMIVICSLFVVSLLLITVGLSVGSTLINPFEVVKHLIGLGNGEHTFIINTLRLPRTILAFMTGIGLGVSGLILQGVIRNPLASPDIIGITGGAALAAVGFLTVFSGAIGLTMLPFAAIAGAAVVSMLLYLLAWKNGVTPLRLVLIGIGINAAMGALTTMMIVISPTYSTSKAYIWLTGSVYGSNWSDVFGLLPWILVLVPLALLYTQIVNVKVLGDDIAAGLGVKVQLHRFILILISVALAGSSVAFAGGIGFVGLIAPHISRKLVGWSFGGLVPVTAMVGGLVVLIADIVARTAFLPLDLPAGVFVSGIGAPFFIYLLYQTRNQ